MPTSPGLTNQAGVRTALRVAGPILAVAGAVTCVTGFVKFIQFGNSTNDGGGDGFPGLAMAMFMGGFVVFAIGMTMARAGFLGVGVRYASGEIAPVAKDGLEYLTGGQGLSHLGRTEATGPFCRACGTRNDATAKFCDGCGASLD